MKSKPLVTLLLFAILLVAAAVWQLNRGRVAPADTLVPSGKLVPEFPVNAIQRVLLTDSDGSVTLERGEEGWTVAERGGYPASFEVLAGFLRKINDLAPLQSITAGTSHHPRLGLVLPAEDSSEGTGTLVRFFVDAEEPVASLVLGNEYVRDTGEAMGFGTFPSGRYVRLADEPDRIWLVKETFADAQTTPAYWIDRTFLKVEKAIRIEIVAPQEDRCWVLEREHPDSVFRLVGLAESEVVDETKLLALNFALASASPSDLLHGDTPPDFEDAVRITVSTAEGFAYLFEVAGENEANDRPVRVTVSAEIAAMRLPEGDESGIGDDELNRREARFAEELDRLQQKLELESKLSGKTFLLPSYHFTPLLKARSEFLVAPDEGAVLEAGI